MINEYKENKIGEPNNMNEKTKQAMANVNKALSELEASFKEDDVVDDIGKPWDPGFDNTYFAINEMNDSLCAELLHSDHGADHIIFENYSAFPTKQKAIKTAKRERAIRKLELIAERLNGDWVPDWKDNMQAKWYIYNEKSGIRICENVTQNAGKIYFQSEDKAQQALNNMTKDELCHIFRVEDINS